MDQEHEEAFELARKYLWDRLTPSFVEKYLEMGVMGPEVHRLDSTIVYYVLRDKDIMYPEKKGLFGKGKLLFRKEDLLFYGCVFVKDRKIATKEDMVPKFEGDAQSIRIWKKEEAKRILAKHLKDQSIENTAHTDTELIDKVDEGNFESGFVFSNDDKRFCWFFTFRKPEDAGDSWCGTFTPRDVFFVDADTGKVTIGNERLMRNPFGDFVPDEEAIVD
ncbi:hypothetical protein KY362_04610 [Candidatus Woesearchaeota archaeon]|nr:hypothetical protein [Candidatus Woesearchaeota archaeon]